DVMNIDADALTEKVKGQLLELNEPAEGYEGKSTLEVIYPSVIISGMLSAELDRVLLDGEDEEGNPAPMIDKEVLSAIRNGKRYPQSEICQLIKSVKEFGINSFDEIDGLDFNDIKGKQDKIDDICLSKIIKGVLTLQISQNNELGADHPLAYETELKVFKTQEIKSLVKLVDEVSSSGSDVNLEEMYFDDIKLCDLKEAVFADDGTVKSYLILSAVSGCILRNGQLLVNTDLVDNYECVRPSEVLALINAFTALEGEDISLGKWSTENKGFAYPDKAQREEAFKSELVRAKLTEQLMEANASVSGGTDNFVGVSNFTEYTDRRTREKERLISYSQMLALFTALDWFSINGSFEIPEISIMQIKADYNAWGEEAGGEYVENLFAADVLRYKICDSIM
ncbi:MAG: hypothetical protein K2L72_00130, partial [Clostridia bacterium]|nr:hypothetical protein [Clostridia bacterium]